MKFVGGHGVGAVAGSRSSRSAWIEILLSQKWIESTVMSRSSRSAWIEISSRTIEEVNRSESRSSRSAWIEITTGSSDFMPRIVALLAERVD